MQLRDRKVVRARPAPVRSALRNEAAELEEWRRASWTMFWLLAGGKLITMIALAVVAYRRLHPLNRTIGVIILLNWSWVLLAMLFVVGPITYWLRMRRARRKRAKLIYAEWHVQ